MKTLKQILIFPFIFFIKLYQWIISPWLGAKCRYTPTCSHYGMEALKKYGLIKMLVLVNLFNIIIGVMGYLIWKNLNNKSALISYIIFFIIYFFFRENLMKKYINSNI